MQTQERRAAPRVSVDLILNKYVRGFPHLTRASNISRDGLLLHPMSGPKASGARDVILQFQLPGQERVIACGAKVVRSQTRESAALFTKIAPEYQRMIDDYVRGNAAA